MLGKRNRVRAVQSASVPESKPRVLLTAQRPQRRGAELFAGDLASALKALGCEVAIVYLYRYDGESGLLVGPGDFQLGFDSESRLERFPGFQPAVLGSLRKAISRFGPHIVQAHGGRSVKYVALASWLTKEADWRFVYRNIGQPRRWVRGRTRKWAIRKLLASRFDGIVAVSSGSMEEIESFYEPRVLRTVIPRGVDPQSLKPRCFGAETRRSLGVAEDDAVVLWVGSLTPEKRPDRAVRIIRSVASEDARVSLWIVGEGPLREKVERLVAKYQIGDKVRLIGATQDVGSYIAASDLFLLTSDTEGTPGVLLEAGALGVASVASRVGGVGECIQHGKNGLLFDQWDEEAASDAILKLIRSPEEREKLGRRMKDAVEDRFHIRKIAADYLAFYQKLLSAGVEQDSVLPPTA